MTTRMKRRIALAKDLILFGIGSGGITYQIITDGNNLLVMLVCATLVGVQGIAGLIATAHGAPTVPQQQLPTVDSSESTSDNSSTT